MSEQSQTPVCPICDGMKVVTRRVPIGHPDFGKAFPCQCQKERLASKQMERVLELSRLSAYDSMRFDNFQDTHESLSFDQNQMLKIALERTMSFATDPEGQWLLLRGTYGTGKTHLAAAIGHHCLAMGRRVIFMTVPDLLDHLRVGYMPNAAVNYDTLFEKLRQIPVLILDDLGSESPTPWANEKLYQLLDYRYINRLSTVITTNQDVKTLDARIQSRLLDQHLIQIVELNLPDFRRGDAFAQDSTLANLSLYAEMRFENFDLRRSDLSAQQLDNLRRVYQIAHDYALNLRDMTQKWLVLLGGPGVGKTHLAASIANHCQYHAIVEPVMFVTSYELIDHLRSTFDPESRQTLSGRFHEIRTTPLLVIDHFQLYTATIWAREKLFQLMDYRYLAKLPTVITKTGYDMKDLDASFLSRFLDARLCRVYLIDAPNYRGGSYARR